MFSENRIEMLLTCAACVLIGLIFILIKFALWRRKYLLMPGTKPNFCNSFGDILEFDTSKDLQLQLLDVLKRIVESFRKQKLFCVWISYFPFVFLIKAEAVKEALKKHKMVDKSWQYSYFKVIFGDGIFASTGEKWKSRRKLLTSCFHPDILRSFLPIFNEKSENLVSALRDETQKDFTEIIDFTTSCTVDIMSDTIFGVASEIFRKENFQYVKSLKRLASIFVKRVLNSWQMPFFVFMKTKSGREAMYNVNVMQQVTRTIIAEKKNRYLSGDKSSESGKRKAFMDLLLQLHIETGDLNEEGIQEEVDTFAVAAHETVANASMWALYLIGLYPEVQARMHHEIDQIFGEDLERHVTEEDLIDLQYLDCVLKECSRLYPTIPVYAREAKEDIKICGYTIPKGTTCVIPPYFLHRDEDVFPDPEKFDPDRFSPENSASIPECAYIPFSVGPRNCIGFKYAETELKIMICSVLRNFAIESLDPRHEIVPIMNVTLGSSTPIRIRIRSRSFHKSS